MFHGNHGLGTKDHPSSLSSSTHILVIDDETVIGDYLSSLLARPGLRVSTATTASAALCLLDEFRFDLAILEIAMRDIDGLELLRTITSQHPSLPVLVLTGIGFDEESMREAHRFGATGYVSKRLPPHELLLEIRHVLNPPRRWMNSSSTASTVIKTAMILMFFLLGISSSAVSLQELRQHPNLTPYRFASYFSRFTFKRHSEVQDPETFLKVEAGDCDDYATLAATVLSEKGYTPRLITVRMPHETHVVVYIEETQSYLDFNNRRYLVKTISCNRSLQDIARKVSKSFDEDWISVSEFTYRSGAKLLGQTLRAPHK